MPKQPSWVVFRDVLHDAGSTSLFLCMLAVGVILIKWELVMTCHVPTDSWRVGRWHFGELLTFYNKCAWHQWSFPAHMFDTSGHSLLFRRLFLWLRWTLTPREGPNSFGIPPWLTLADLPPWPALLPIPYMWLCLKVSHLLLSCLMISSTPLESNCSAHSSQIFIFNTKNSPEPKKMFTYLC